MTSPDERNRSVERWLEKVRPATASPAGECLDAETAAAWVDGGLSPAAMEQAEMHVADCVRCQSIVRLLVQPPEPVAVLQPARAWRQWLNWAVPVAAGATALLALAVWVTVPSQSPGQKEPERAALEDERRLDNAAPQVATPRPDAAQRFEAAPSANAAGGAEVPPPAQTARRSDAPSSPEALSAPEASAPSAAPKSAAAAEALAATSAPEESRMRAAAAPPAAAGDSARDAVAPEPAATRRLMRAAQPLEIVAPDPRVRWRIEGSSIQRSTDGGTNWVPTPSVVSSDLTAGSAPSGFVCWLVGRSGVVLLTTNGTTWRRVPFQDAVDLAAVSAQDARSASVTAADGRTFTTGDGGGTWTVR